MEGAGLQLGVILVLLVVGFVVGRFLEQKHLKNLKKREAILKKVVLSASKNNPFLPEDVAAITLVCGGVVIARDYFKEFVASWINVFGGEVFTYRKMLERARREAALRMIASAIKKGRTPDAIINVRYETSAIGVSANLELMAYGTAVYKKR